MQRGHFLYLKRHSVASGSSCGLLERMLAGESVALGFCPGSVSHYLCALSEPQFSHLANEDDHSLQCPGKEMGWLSQD